MDKGIKDQWIAGQVDVLYAQVGQSLILINLFNHLGHHDFISYLDLLQSELLKSLSK
jgi:hypothetical protein